MSLKEVTECGAAFRALATTSSTFDEAAAGVVNQLFDALRDPVTGDREALLVRFFRTRPYRVLDADRRAWVDRVLAGESPRADMACLVLEATRGTEAEWNSPETSRGHRVFPLGSSEMIDRYPMISRLLKQLGVDIASMVTLNTALFVDPGETQYNVFFVPTALGSAEVPAQEEFVIPYGVRSVVGFGGQLPSGSVFAVIVFSRAKISRESAEAFRTLALSVKLAVLPFDGEAHE